jgi:hypothetical protein
LSDFILMLRDLDLSEEDFKRWMAAKGELEGV